MTTPAVDPNAPAAPPAPAEPATPPAPTAPAAPPAAPASEPRMFDEDYVKKLRAESADYRTKYQGEKTRNETTLAAIAKSLGLAEGETLDPAKLQEQLTATQRENRELKVSHAVVEAARKHGADTDLLVPYLRGSSALDGLDPASATFAKDLADVVKNLVEKNPKLKASSMPARTIGDFPGGTPAVQQITREQLKGMSPEAIDKARKAGALDQLMRTGQ